MYTKCKTPSFSRRILLGLGAATFASRALALGRQPLGGRLQLRIPWPVRAIDPHALDDVTAAIFGGALFDSLYATDASGGVIPSLAESRPEVAGGKVRVKLRAGIVSAQGRSMGARDVIASIRRAKSLGARAWLADVPVPNRIDDTTIAFPIDGNSNNVATIERTLASPLVAIVPTSFVPSAPDGTGPMQARARVDGFSILRNNRAANGPSFLDEIVVLAASDLAASLRSFESGTDDIGWLGLGLHEPRKDAIAFDAGACGWALLRTGALAGVWDAPGTAQQLCDGIAPTKLSYLSLGSWSSDHDAAWGGPPCDVIVRDDSPWLLELARGVSATLSRPGHEITVRSLSISEFVSRRASRSYVLAIDAVRPFSKSTEATLAALASASDVALAADIIRHPPRLGGNVDPRSLTRTLRVGVLGEIRVKGGRVANLALPAADFSLDWPNATRPRIL